MSDDATSFGWFSAWVFTLRICPMTLGSPTSWALWSPMTTVGSPMRMVALAANILAVTAIDAASL